ncbi:MAG: hypothetical protein LBU34_10625 [Planctomycetaceae bacterium]|nr:hypothetical protein [Planctomycetaceae bacterium]
MGENPLPKHRLPIGNRNIQHYTNSRSANAAATVAANGFHPTVAYFLLAKTVGNTLHTFTHLCCFR